MRLDLYLLENQLFESRNKCQQAIKAAQVYVNGNIITSPKFEVSEKDEILLSNTIRYVSRGGEKLAKAIQEFKLNLNESTILDLGASTGGFSDCALKHGAKKIFAVDVGTNQLHHSLLDHPAIVNMPNTNVKTLALQEKFDYIVVDLSFISLSKVFGVIVKHMDAQTKLIALVKPQFEAKNQNIDKNGKVKDKNVHIEILKEVKACALSHNLHLNGLIFSPLLGEKSRNIEYFMLLSKQLSPEVDIKEIVLMAYQHFK